MLGIGDGGAYPECHVAQYPLNMGKKKVRGLQTPILATAHRSLPKTAAGNTDIFNASEPHSNLRYTVSVNGKDLEPWVIP